MEHPEIVKAEFVDNALPEPARVPRRYGVGTLLLITLIYAVLLSALQSLGAHIAVTVSLVAYTTGVGLAQAVLFGGKKPRQASVAAGAVLAVVIAATLGIVDCWDRGGPASGGVVAFIFIVAPITAIFGAGFGYVAGGAVAGFFFVAERVDEYLEKKKVATGYETKNSPFDDEPEG